MLRRGAGPATRCHAAGRRGRDPHSRAGKILRCRVRGGSKPAGPAERGTTFAAHPYSCLVAQVEPDEPETTDDSLGDVPGYPRELEHHEVLADGRRVFVRPIRPSDEAELRRNLATADEETLHARFLGSPPHDDASIRRLVEVDYTSRLALVALAPDGTGVGVARYEGQPGSSSAEVAVAVHADWRRVGLGSLLLRRLGRAALPRGITRFTALTLAENRPALSVLRRSGLAFTLEIHGGTSDIIMLLEEPADQVRPDPTVT